MAGVTQQGASKVFRFANTVTPPGSGTTVLAGPVPSQGFGVTRCFCASDVAGTLKFLQAPRAVGSATPIFRQTDSYSVTASGTTQVFDSEVRADYVEVTWTPTAGNPTTFEFSAQLLP